MLQTLCIVFTPRSLLNSRSYRDFSVVGSKLQGLTEPDIIFPLIDLCFPQRWAGGLQTIRGFSCGSVLPTPIKSGWKLREDMTWRRTLKAMSVWELFSLSMTCWVFVKNKYIWLEAPKRPTTDGPQSIIGRLEVVKQWGPMCHDFVEP